MTLKRFALSLAAGLGASLGVFTIVMIFVAPLKTFMVLGFLIGGAIALAGRRR